MAKKLPETVDFYNHTKLGVDIFDSMARKYTTKAGSRRWPVHVLYNLLDIFGHNSYIVYQKLFNEKITRRKYLLQLGEQLCKSATSFTLPQEISLDSNKRKQCQVGKHQNKTQISCVKCSKWTCGPCTGQKQTIVICKNCL